VKLIEVVVTEDVLTDEDEDELELDELDDVLELIDELELVVEIELDELDDVLELIDELELVVEELLEVVDAVCLSFSPQPLAK
jgi:hypothetical protein